MLAWRHSRMPSAVHTFRDAITHGRIRHGGDPLARQHVLSAVLLEREYGVIMSKKASRKPIDAATAVAMAVEYAAGLEPEPVSVYETRFLTGVS
jgi:phage terminase large subunit-like protein